MPIDYGKGKLSSPPFILVFFSEIMHQPTSAESSSLENNRSNMVAPDLRQRAERAARDAGFETRFSAQALAEAESRGRNSAPNAENLSAGQKGVRDMRGLLWSSIDNDESRDLDQVEWCEALENNAIRLCVGVADVASAVPPGSAMDKHAALNTTSIYTGVEVFPMLPERLSTDLTSLLPEQERLVFVIEMIVGADGKVEQSSIYRAVVCNRAKLVYEIVGAWLDGQSEVPASVASVPDLEAQLRLQWEAARRLKKQREAQGALDVEMPEARPVVQDGRVVNLALLRKNAARLIIENFMVTANMTLAQKLEEARLPAIQRVVREPERWPRIRQLAAQRHAELPEKPDAPALSAFLNSQRRADPQHYPELSLAVLKLLGRGEYGVVRGAEDSIGHFGLGMHNYTHSTAPNRRFPDLVTQRLLMAQLNGEAPPYNVEELENIAAHCTEREAAAQKVERLMRKVAAAAFMQPRIGEVFEAIVTGISQKAAYVRLTNPPVEGRVLHGERGLDVGDKLRVRLLNTDIEQGFIDFELC